MIETQLSLYLQKFRPQNIPAEVIHEARRRVLDSFGCCLGAQQLKPLKILHATYAEEGAGPAVVWGKGRAASAEIAVLLNGAGVRAWDWNDTYLSKEPCHPSDLLAPLWAACELSRRPNQGRRLLEAMVLGYEVMVRLCDAASIRAKGWDHVTYLPIASAVGCSYIFGLDAGKTRHAIALAATGNNALRQTRVGTISDWKAACAAYAARAGLLSARLSMNGFTGPADVFSGRHGFFNQVSGPFHLSRRPLGPEWGILKTHTKFFPAEHHAQSAIEAALRLRPGVGNRKIRSINIRCFDAAAQIIGSEKEKWAPTTRETADHSLPYMVAAALIDGDLTLAQYARKRFMDRDIRELMRKTRVAADARYNRLYPNALPTRVELVFANGDRASSEVIRPRGYAGRPMNDAEITDKFLRLTGPVISDRDQNRLINRVWAIGRDEIRRFPTFLKDFWNGLSLS